MNGVTDIETEDALKNSSLGEIKADPELRQIPIVVLTTSKAQEDVFRSYDWGVNSFTGFIHRAGRGNENVGEILV